MSYKKVEKVRVHKRFFIYCLKKDRKYSLRQLAREYNSSEEVSDKLKRSDKALRTALNKGEMRRDVLESIAKFVDLEPDYLSGEQIQDIRESDLPEDMKRALVSRTIPRPYGTTKGLGGPEWLEEMLMAHGISRTELWKDGRLGMLSFGQEIEEVIVPVLIKHFAFEAADEKRADDMWSIWSEIDNAIDEEMMGPTEP